MRNNNAQSSIILFTGCGFFFLWVDILFGHVTAGLKHPAMWFPVVFVPFAAAASFVAGLRPSSGVLKIFQILCWAAVALGMMGFCFHLSRLLVDFNRGDPNWSAFVRLMRYPPVLAPLSISGLGVLGLLGISRRMS